MDSIIFDQFQACFAQELDLAGQDLGALESAITAKMRQLGQGLLARLVSRGGNGYKGSSLACDCGGSMRFVGHRPRDIQTVFGWITVNRAYYHCRECGRSCVPYDDASGLGPEGISPGLARACCTVAADDSFSQTARKIEELLGQNVSDKTVERVVHRVGSVVIRQEARQMESLLEHRRTPKAVMKPQRLYICPDGTVVHEKDGWHEAKVGCIYWEDEQFERGQRYIGCFDNSDVFGKHLWLEACRCGLREAWQVVYIGDGAGWVRSIHNKRFSKAVFIVDWYHASEHVWNCGRALFGEGTRATETWVVKPLNLLWEGWTRKLLRFLERQRGKYRGCKRDAIETLYRYISTNEQQMRYDVFRARGYEIGSGAVEGACKHVVGKRLKQSGMIWTRAGSSATLAVRVTWLNKDWDKLWSTKPLAA
jgi:hypothetical protein